MAHYSQPQTSFPRTNDFSDHPGLSVPVSANSSSNNCLPGFSQLAANAHAGPAITVGDDNLAQEATTPGPVQESSRKRQRSDVSRRDVAYPRKRAITACRQCRARKVKCNNARPTCGNCDASKASCSYEDTQDFSTFDPASIVIIDKLSQVLSRLDQIQTPVTGPFPVSTQVGVVQPSNPLTTNDTADQSSPGHRGNPEQDQISDEQQDQLHIPSSKTNVDSILQWPIFGNRYPPNYLTDAVYELEAYDGGEGHNLSSSKLGSTKTRSIGIDEDGISDLVRRFLDLVYIKNPILDIDTICAYTQNVVEDGLRWDAPSCLVLLACALGCVATPYLGRPETSPEAPATSLEAHEQDLRDGEAYYNLARRRFGLLEVGILPSQCHFLAGVYNMYIMRPLAAWSQFQSATKSYYLYLQCQARMSARSTIDSVQTSKRRSLEQRLYWSCYKSECELRAEINIPNSSLADVRFTDMHPSPPNMDEDVVSPGFGSSPQDKSSRQQEQTWFYYLTEITLRRLSNRILNLLYTGDHTIWTTDSILFMAEEAEQIEKQLEEWYARLPPLIQFSDDIPTEELPYHVRGRVLEMKTWLYTPFLYYAMHSTPDAPHRNRTKAFVDKSLPHIFIALRSMPCEHRHHGTWYGVRNAIGRCLLVIGAVRCGTIPVMENWRMEIQSLIDRSRYWAAEGPGITRGIEVLESYLQEE
ncbi:hypothetical protein FSARC_2445 [Fusarium sarcochroum]|uniref:Zn(2)-C6 fungal-type domain-containing protein n=1 Tax=Fusarium sarcochroum TaxID=1208366 RepID=A0A8H4U641_9HYPO|nr:hypothetical protein FSARC_2445 [Fusarium sarcochroum]